MEEKVLIEKIKGEITYWEKEMNRYKDDQKNQHALIYYEGYTDGLKDFLSFIEKGRMGYLIEIDNQIKRGFILS